MKSFFVTSASASLDSYSATLRPVRGCTEFVLVNWNTHIFMSYTSSFYHFHRQYIKIISHIIAKCFQNMENLLIWLLDHKIGMCQWPHGVWNLLYSLKYLAKWCDFPRFMLTWKTVLICGCQNQWTSRSRIHWIWHPQIP